MFSPRMQTTHLISPSQLNSVKSVEEHSTIAKGTNNIEVKAEDELRSMYLCAPKHQNASQVVVSHQSYRTPSMRPFISYSLPMLQQPFPGPASAGQQCSSILLRQRQEPRCQCYTQSVYRSRYVVFQHGVKAHLVPFNSWGELFLGVNFSATTVTNGGSATGTSFFALSSG